jgi:hypothetical protein
MPKLKLNYKPRKSPPREHYRFKGKALLEYRAIEYARWLAQRDGVALPDAKPWVKYESRSGGASAVKFGDVQIDIPNHDWEPRVTVEFASDD